MHKDTQVTTRLRNDVALHAEIGFKAARQLCVFLVTVAQINVQDEEQPMKTLLGINDIVKMVRKSTAKRSGSVRDEIINFIDKIGESNYMKFPSGVKFQGKDLPELVPVYHRIKPIEAPKGNIMYEFEFHEDMRPYIKKLKSEYVTLDVPVGIKSGHTVRFYMMAKAHFDRMKGHSKSGIVSMELELDEMKRILGVSSSYKVFKDFKKWVIKPIVADINEMGILHIKDVQYLRNGRKIAHLVFEIEEGHLLSKDFMEDIVHALPEKVSKKPKKKSSGIPTEKEISRLAVSQLQAYDFLISKKCYEQIAYKAIFKLPAEIFKGHENLFYRHAWAIFEKGTSYKKASANEKAAIFVKWLYNKEFAERHLGDLIDSVSRARKVQQPTARRMGDGASMSDIFTKSANQLKGGN